MGQNVDVRRNLGKVMLLVGYIWIWVERHKKRDQDGAEKNKKKGRYPKKKKKKKRPQTTHEFIKKSRRMVVQNFLT